MLLKTYQETITQRGVVIENVWSLLDKRDSRTPTLLWVLWKF